MSVFLFFHEGFLSVSGWMSIISLHGEVGIGV